MERGIKIFGERCRQREEKEISGSFRFLIPSLLKFSCSPSDVPWDMFWFFPSLFNELTRVLLLSTSVLTTTASVRRRAPEQGGCFDTTHLWQHSLSPRGAEAEQLHKTLEFQARPLQKHVRLEELSDVLPCTGGRRWTQDGPWPLGCGTYPLHHIKEGWVTCRQQDSPGGFANHRVFLQIYLGAICKTNASSSFLFHLTWKPAEQSRAEKWRAFLKTTARPINNPQMPEVKILPSTHSVDCLTPDSISRSHPKDRLTPPKTAPALVLNPGSLVLSSKWNLQYHLAATSDSSSASTPWLLIAGNI